MAAEDFQVDKLIHVENLRYITIIYRIDPRDLRVSSQLSRSFKGEEEGRRVEASQREISRNYSLSRERDREREREELRDKINDQRNREMVAGGVCRGKLQCLLLGEKRNVADRHLPLCSTESFHITFVQVDYFLQESRH